MSREPRRSWVSRLPLGIQEQAGWLFIGILFFLSGLTYALGISESTVVTKAIGPTPLHFWGVGLAFGGGLLSYAIIRSRIVMERLALRFSSISILVFLGFVIVSVPVINAVFSVALGSSLVLLMEIRAAVIKDLLRVAPKRRNK